MVTADTINANNSFRGAQQAWDSNDERDVDFRLSRTMSLTTVARGSLAHFSVRSILDRSPCDVAVPVTDLPPCLVVPVCRTSAENAVIRAFADLAAQHESTDGGRPGRAA